MPLEDLAEVAFRFTGRVIGRIFIEIFFEILCYYIGRVILFIVTIGSYNHKKQNDNSGTLESAVGLISLITLFVIYVVIKNK